MPDRGYHTFAFVAFASLLLLKQYRSQAHPKRAKRELHSPKDDGASKDEVIANDAEMPASQPSDNTASAIQVKVVVRDSSLLTSRGMALKCELMGVMVGAPTYVILGRQAQVLVERHCLWFVLVKEVKDRFGVDRESVSRSRRDWIVHVFGFLCLTLLYHVTRGNITLIHCAGALAIAAATVAYTLAL